MTEPGEPPKEAEDATEPVKPEASADSKSAEKPAPKPPKASVKDTPAQQPSKPVSEKRKLLQMGLVQRTATQISMAKTHLTAGASRVHGRAVLYSNTRPSEVTDLTGCKVRELVCGEDHVIAQDGGGKVWSWGRGESGQLGHGSSEHCSHPKPIAALDHVRVKEVACGSHCTAALMEGGELYTWGDNAHGQLGHGDRVKCEVPRAIAGMERRHVHQLACGASHMLVLTTARDVYAWGSNRYGQLGFGNANKSCTTPTQLRVMSGLDIKQLAAGEGHSCVLTSFGDIYTWGRGDYGQLGHGDMENKDVPTPLQAFDQRTQAQWISVGADFVIATTYNGVVYSWGRNCFGQLGHGMPLQADSQHRRHPEDQPAPKIIDFFAHPPPDPRDPESEPDAITLGAIVCGAHHVLAISEDRRDLYAWGRGAHGQLGLDGRSSAMQPTPQLVPRFGGATILRAANHSMVVVQGMDSKGSRVYAWGRGSFGQLGFGSGKTSVPQELKDELHTLAYGAPPPPHRELSRLSTASSSSSLRRPPSRPATSLGFSQPSRPGTRSSSRLSRRGAEAAAAAGPRPVSCEARLTSMVPNAFPAPSHSAFVGQSSRRQLLRGSIGRTSSNGSTSCAVADDEAQSKDNGSTFVDSFVHQHATRPPHRKHADDPAPLSMGDLLRLVDQRLQQQNMFSSLGTELQKT